MIAPAETTTIVDVRTEEDILEVLNDTNRLIGQAFCRSKCVLCWKGRISDVDVDTGSHELFYLNNIGTVPRSRSTYHLNAATDLELAHTPLLR